MIIDPSLAEMLVQQAIFAPYRQIDPMNTCRFVEWLRKRGIGLGLHDWRTLHHLWHIGILHPVAIRDTDDFGQPNPIFHTAPKGRLVQVGETSGGRVYADLGVDVAEHAPLRSSHSIRSELRNSLIWHPFQLWEFHHLDSLLQLRYQWSLMLCGPGRHRKQRDQIWERQLDEVRHYGDDKRHSSFLRLVALLLSAEPLVHSWIFPRIRMHAKEYREYWDWRESLTDMDLVGASGMTIAEAAEWH
jgi:hypothetical protein